MRRSWLLPLLAVSVFSDIACGAAGGWQDVLPRDQWDQPARVWRWRRAVVEPSRIVVGDGAVWLVGFGGVLRSADKGTSWRLVRRGVDDFREAHASQDGQRFCVIGEGEIPGEPMLHCTADEGNTWWYALPKWPVELAGTATADRLWLQTHDTRSDEALIWHSRDGGKAWSEEWRGRRGGDLYVSADGSLALLAWGNGATVRRDIVTGRWKEDEKRLFGEDVGYAGFVSPLTGTADGEAVWTVRWRPEPFSLAVVRLVNRASVAESCTTPAPLRNSPRSWLRMSSDGKSAFLGFEAVPIPGRIGAVFRSADGCSWTAWTGVAQSARDVAIGSQSGELWALTDMAFELRLQHSLDDGKTWRHVWNGPLSTFARDGLAALDDGTVVGLHGPTVVEGSNSGWRQNFLDAPGTMFALAATANRSAVWAMGDGGVVDESRSPGSWETWRVPVEQCPAPCSLLDVFAAADGKRLWAVGASGVLLHSTDAARTWTGTAPPREGGDPPTFLAVHGSPDGRNVVAVADEGVAVRFTGRGWERAVRVTDDSLVILRDVFVAGDGQVVWTVGGDSAMFRSNDGGSTWQRRHIGVGNSTLVDLYSVRGRPDGRELWVGSAAGALGSSDGGISWHLETIGSLGVPAPKAGSTSWANFRETPSVRSLHIVHGNAKPWAVVDAESTTAAGVFEAEAMRARPQITEARLVSDTAGRARLEVRIPTVEGTTPLTLRVSGGSAQALAADRLIPMEPAAFGPPRRGDDVWALAFDPTKSFGVPQGDAVHIRIDLEEDRVRQVFALPALFYVPWYEPYREPTVAIAGFIGALGGAGLLLLLVWPIALVRLTEPLALAIDAVPIPAVGAPLKVLAHLLVIPALASHPRALDAWVRRHRLSVQRAFDTIPAVRASVTFVALPLRVGDPRSGELIERPGPDLVGRCFGQDRAVVEIVGTGGAGKTMLAVQIARWAMDGTGRENGMHPMLPVFVDEDTDDLAGVVRRKLRAMVDSNLPASLCAALVRKRRVLVIVDRLSERDVSTQRHLSQVQGTAEIGALLITTRASIPFESGSAMGLYPQPLGSSTLLHLMTSLLRAMADTSLFGGIHEQIDLGHRLAALIPSRAGEAVPVTPLLVKLFVDRALALARDGRSLDQLPASVPDAYFEYLRGVNPADPDVQNHLPQESMVRAATVLACFALRTDEPGSLFLPREFGLARAREALAEKWDGPEGVDPVRRLVNNGVLLERTSGPEPTFRFVLDPVAEFLAAYGLAEKCGANRASWEAVASRLGSLGAAGEGFGLAFRLTCDAYGDARGWGCK